MSDCRNGRSKVGPTRVMAKSGAVEEEEEEEEEKEEEEEEETFLSMACIIT